MKQLLKKIMVLFSKQATQWVWPAGKLPTHFKNVRWPIKFVPSHLFYWCASLHLI